VLIAGVGNILLGDDGFGVEIVRRLAEITMPDVEAFGIRGIHLAYDVYDHDYESLILVDARLAVAIPEPCTLSRSI
jgi:hydrogenase maturation protease